MAEENTVTGLTPTETDKNTALYMYGIFDRKENLEKNISDANAEAAEYGAQIKNGEAILKQYTYGKTLLLQNSKVVAAIAYIMFITVATSVEYVGLILGIVVAGAIVWGYTKFKTRGVKEYVANAREQSQLWQNQSNRYQSLLNEFLHDEEVASALAIWPHDMQTSFDAANVFDLIRVGRADSLKEGFNIWSTVSHQQRMEQLQGQSVNLLNNMNGNMKQMAQQQQVVIRKIDEQIVSARANTKSLIAAQAASTAAIVSSIGAASVNNENAIASAARSLRR